MPNIKSAKKRVLITNNRTQKNNIVKTTVKTAIKKFDVACASNDEAQVKEAYSDAVSSVDKAVSHGVMKKSTANNKKASLGKKLNSVGK